ncbi:MAG: UDP-3-O-(3-hydroxymyristoyl)glucosamine N-acyltransferase [Acidobacteriota bacterium]
MTETLGTRLADLAESVGGRVVGDASLRVSGVRTLDLAESDHLSFLTSSKYRDQALQSRAAALLVGPEDASLAEETGAVLIVVEQPYLALARILAELFPSRSPEPGVHAQAVVAGTAVIDPSATVGPFAVVGEGSIVERGARIGAHVAVGRDCIVGEDSLLHPHVVLYDGTVLAARAVLHSGSVLGADGFGYATGEFGNVKMPQVGHVEIGEDVEIGANSTVDRATLDATRVGRGTKIDNLVQVGHNTQIGENCIFCGQAGVSGSATIEDRVVLAGQSGVAGHLTIGHDVQVAAKSAVLQSVDPSQQVGGIPTVPLGKWRRQVSLLSKLQELRKRVRSLEKALANEASGEDGASDE